MALDAADVDGGGGTADPGARFGNLRMVLCAAVLDAPEPIVTCALPRDACAKEWMFFEPRWIVSCQNGVEGSRGGSLELLEEFAGWIWSSMTSICFELEK